MEKDTQKDILHELETSEYKYGFVTDIETETIGRGLSEEVVRLISEKKGEPEWMLERRLANVGAPTVGAPRHSRD